MNAVARTCGGSEAEILGLRLCFVLSYIGLDTVTGFTLPHYPANLT